MGLKKRSGYGTDAIRSSSKSLSSRMVFALLIVLSIYLLSVSFATGMVTIDSFDAPSSISEGDTLSASFSASSDTDSEIKYKIYMDGNLAAEYDQYSALLNYSSSGMHSLKFFAADNESNVSETQNVEIVDVSMSVIINSPVNGLYNSRQVNVSAHVSTYASQCNYSMNGSSGILSGLLLNTDSGLGRDFSSMITVPDDGAYFVNVICKSNINFDSASASASFSVDTVNPSITSQSHTIDLSNVVTLNVATNLATTCKYDSSDKPFDSMASYFSTTGALQHSTKISSLPDGSYTYYIKCRTSAANIATTSITFTVAASPTASISISESSPLKAGTYKVRLTTSEPVISAPTLYFNFNSDSSARYITLTGSGSSWEGYMIIEDNLPDKIGTFHYSATDYSNNVGTRISGGEIFLIDTLKPVAPSSIDAYSQYDGSIKLKWYYDGEQVNKYNIYRSTVGNPEYVDYYESTTGVSFIDHEVIDGVIYYYAVAAVDDAENDGELSAVAYATSDNRVASQSSSSGSGDKQSDSTSSLTGSGTVSDAPLDSGLAQKVDQLMTELNTYLLDIDAVKSDLNKINDPAKLKIISLLKLSENINSARSTIEGLISEAGKLKDVNLKASELDVKLNKLKMDAIKTKALAAEDIIVSEQSSFDQVTQSSDIDNAISEVVTVNLSRKILDNYSLENKKMQDDVIVKTEVFIFRIKYLGKDDYDRYTLVKKVVSSSKGLSGVSIIETIPKSFEQKASDLMFDIDGQKSPTIVKEDPVLRWDVDTLNTRTIYYMSSSNAEMSSAKESKTVVLYTPDFKVTDTIASAGSSSGGNVFTGLVGLDVPDLSQVTLMQWLVMMGVMMVLGLGTYYMVLEGKEKRRNIRRIQDHRIIPTRAGTAVPRSQSNLQSRQLPVRSQSPSNTRPDTHQRFNLDLMMEKSNDMINSMDYEGSRVIYNECMKRFRNTRFRNDAEQKEADMMLNHIYIKLVAYRMIYSSRKHLAAKNISSAKSDLSMIYKVCEKLDMGLRHVDDDHRMAEEKFFKYVDGSKKYVEKMVGN